MDDAVISLVASARMIVPEVVLLAAACLLFLGALTSASRRLWAAVSVAAILVAGILWFRNVGVENLLVDLSFSPFRHDDLTWIVKGIGLATGLIFVLLSWNQVSDRHAAEYYACLLLIFAGVNLTAAANDMVVLFLALELISIPTYVILYLPKHDQPAQEAATKYFLLSVFSSALLLYGLSFVYGAFGSTNLEVVREGVRGLTPMHGPPGTLLIALIMIVAGLGFRITAVPFHFYAPDVYQGTATTNAALLAYVPKIAGFLALARVITLALLGNAANEQEWVKSVENVGWTLSAEAQWLLWIVATVTMFLGNFLALLQDNLKRMLAYSSVAHAGYMLIGLGVGTLSRGDIGGLEALLFYLTVYGAMTVGAFAVLACLSQPDRSVENVDDLAGVGWSHPLIALAMTLFLFSLIGLPPTAGFWGKFYLFFAAWGADAPTVRLFGASVGLFKLLAILLAVNAAIGAWFYLRIVAVLYLRQPVKPLKPARDWATLAVVAICAALVVVLFVAPGLLGEPLQSVQTVR